MYNSQKCEAVLSYYTDQTKSDKKGEHFITANTLIFGIPNTGGHHNCFKLICGTASGTEKEIIFYSDAPNIKMKWIYAIESFIMEAKNIMERNKLSKTSFAKLVRKPKPESDELSQANDEKIIQGLDLKSKKLIGIVERFLKAWIEGDNATFAQSVTPSKLYFDVA